MYAFPKRALFCLERKKFECPWRATGRLPGPLLFALGLHGAGFAALAVTRSTCKSTAVFLVALIAALEDRGIRLNVKKYEYNPAKPWMWPMEPVVASKPDLLSPPGGASSCWVHLVQTTFVRQPVRS